MIVGLTGSIATGKSTVSKYLVSKGYVVIDSDVIARQVVSKGHPVLVSIANTFGEEMLLASGELNRKALGQLIFSDESAREKLNAITHPAINAEMHRQIDLAKSEGQDLIFCDVPLLFEGEMRGEFDEVWVVYVSEDLQLQRLRNRDTIDEETAKGKIASQLSIELKRTFADIIIFNDQSKEETYKQIDKILKEKTLC